MHLREVLYNYNIWWEEEYRAPGIARSRYLERMKEALNRPEITFLVGLRRIGKTTLLKQFIAYLLSFQKPSHILYATFDHPVIQQHSLDEILREFRKMHELGRGDRIYLFLDEILYSPNIFQWLKVINDSENVKIFATSSSSLSLKDQKAFLTGRAHTLRIKPLSFKEYLQFKKKRTEEPHLLERYFEDYMREGGVPEYILRSDPNYLVNLAEDIIMKDVAMRRIHKPEKLKELFLLLLARVGKPITYSKLSKVLGVKEETAEEYVRVLEEAELVHTI